MKMAIAALLAGSVLMAAQSQPGQTAATPSWRTHLSSLPATPPPNTRAQDVVEFEKNMRMAATYLGTSTPDPNSSQWQANRDLVRRMATYLYSLQTLSGDRRLRGEVTRAQRSFDSYGFGPYLAYSLAAEPSVVVVPEGTQQPAQPVRQFLPPFDLNAPEPVTPSETDKETAAELHDRYESDAARSAAVLENAEVLRQNLEMRGMGLNLETATALMRVPQFFRSASKAIRNSDWETARMQLQRAEAETGKIARTVGN